MLLVSSPSKNFEMVGVQILFERILQFWQIDAKHTALAQFACHGNVTAALLNETKDHGEAQAGAFALIFGGEKWFKNMQNR